MSKIWIILLLGLFIRLLLSPFTFHSDILHPEMGGYAISKVGLFNLYDFFPNLPAENPLKITFHDYNFNYPPLVYLFLGGLSSIFSILVGESFRVGFFTDVKSTLGSLPLFIHLLTLKIPYLIFDIGTAILLYKMFASSKAKILALAMWMFNPIAIFSTSMMGSFDVIPTFFTVLSVYLLKKNPLLSALSLGIGASFKIYPLFLLIPLLTITYSWKQRFKMVALGVLPYMLFILLYLPSEGFRSSALLAGQTTKSLYAQIPISGGEAIMLFPLILIFVYLIFLKDKIPQEVLWVRYLVVLLIFFILTHFHPQWLLWLTPFLIIEAVETNLKNILAKLLIFFSWFGMLFFFDPGLTLGLFSPIIPSLYDSQSLWQMLGLNPDYNLARALLQTLFSTAGVYYIYQYLLKKSAS